MSIIPVNSISLEQNNRFKNNLKAVGLVAGGTTIGIGGYAVADMLTRGKKYQSNKQEIKDVFQLKADELSEEIIQKWNNSQKSVSEYEKKVARDYATSQYNSKLEEILSELKILRKNEFKKGLKIASIISFGVSTLAVAGYKLYQTKKTNNNNIEKKETPKYINQTTNLDKFKKQISFTGLVEDMLTYIAVPPDDAMVTEMRSYLRGDNITDEEIVEGKKIADLELSDWPKGVNYSHLYSKPSNLKEYHDLLLKQKYGNNDRPPSYFRNYDKWFNTDKYQAFLTWPDYILKQAKYERMKLVVNNLRLENEKKKQKLIEQETIMNNTKAYYKYRLGHDFLSGINNNDKIVLNAVMIEGGEKKDRDEIIEWVFSNSKINNVIVRDDGSSNETRLNQIYNVIESANKHYEKNSKRTLIYVENFDKLLDKSEKNATIAADLKDILCKLSTDYKSSIIFDTQNSESLDPIALQNHRVGLKINVNKIKTAEDCIKLKKKLIKENIVKRDDTGYEINYEPFTDKKVNIYLGNFGYSKNILWIDSSNSEAINGIINNIDIVKSIPIFKDVVYAEFPKPDKPVNTEKNIYRTDKKTKDYKPIYECRF